MPPGVPCITTGEEVIEKYSYEPWHVPYDFGFLVLLFCGLNLLGFIALHIRAKRQ